MLKSPSRPASPPRPIPDRPEWIHEIKHDGYRLIVQRNGQRVRLWTRNGHDWSDRFPLVTEAALRNRNSSFVLDGEAVLLGIDGRSDFNGLHSRKRDSTDPASTAQGYEQVVEQDGHQASDDEGGRFRLAFTNPIVRRIGSLAF